MEKKTKAFATGAVLSVVTGCLVSENHIEGVYEVLNWMMGESLFTHQLSRVGREAVPVILEIRPDLEVTIEEAEQINSENWKMWLDEWKSRYGEMIEVPRMNIAEHERIDPMSEFVGMVRPDQIIVVGVDNGQE